MQAQFLRKINLEENKWFETSYASFFCKNKQIWKTAENG